MPIADTAALRFRDNQTMAQLNRVDQANQAAEIEDKKLRDACRDFEAILIKQMLDSMRKTVPENSMIKENQGEKIFEDMLYQEYATSMADTGSLGISDIMYQQMTIKNKGDLY